MNLHDRRHAVGLLCALLSGLGLALLPLNWLLTAGGLLVCLLLGLAILRQPLVGVGLTLLFGPLGAYEAIFLPRYGLTLPLDSGQLLLFLTLGSWLLQKLAQRSIVIPRAPLLLPLTLYLGITFVTLFDAISLTLGLIELLKWIEIWLLIVVVVDSLVPHGRWTAAALLGTVFSSGLLQAAIGVWQFAISDRGPEHFQLPSGFSRAFGTFEQPNPFGGFLAIHACLAAGVCLGLLSHQWQTSGRVASGWREHLNRFGVGLFQQPLLLGVAGITGGLALGVITSWSRGAWLGLATGCGVLAFLWPRRVAQGTAVVLIGGLLLLAGWQADLLPASITSRLTGFTAQFQAGDIRGVDINDANFAVLERLAFWQAADGMARDQLWLGVGFGNYAAAYPDYALLNWTRGLGHAHNIYLNLLAETGIIGLITYLLLWSFIAGQIIIMLRHLDWPWRGVALGLLGAWVSLSVHQLVDKLYVNNMYIHFGVLLGLQQWMWMTLVPRSAEKFAANFKVRE